MSGVIQKVGEKVTHGQKMTKLEMQEYLLAVGKSARQSSREIARASVQVKNQALEEIAEALCTSAEQLKSENHRDLELGRKNQLSQAMLDRLELTDTRILSMAEGLRQVASLVDPVGQISEINTQPSGIRVGRMRVPIGVIGIIYESRPNVTADAAGLCLKSGNATVLRGGSEALYSNQAIAACISKGLKKAGLSNEVVQIIQTTDRAAVGAMITMPKYIDVIIPRGGKGLIERISSEAKVPVIKHLDGICHVYIDEFADFKKAIDVSVNSKTQRFGTCNTMETLLIHQSRAQQMLDALVPLYAEAGVELRGCKRSLALHATLKLATNDDWSTEYLAPILSIRIVDSLDQAIDHIETYSSKHTDSIISQDLSRTERFLREVDSSSVMVNVSTRFADGFEYGLGAEIGISTDKLHVRGPVGLDGLTTQKYIVLGDGHIRT